MRPDLTRYEDPWTAQVYDYEVAESWGERDVAFYLRLAQESGGPVLELACGTGRVALPLARAGVRVTGLDISPHMLAVAQRKAALEAPSVRGRLRLVQGDMSAFRLGRRFTLIIIPYRAFQALLERDEQRGCLACCARHLRPDGKLAINLFNPRLSRLAAEGEVEEGPDEFPGPEGVMVRWTARTRFDTANQKLISRQRYQCTDQQGHVRVREHLLELRYLFRFEMECMLEGCGFAVEALYGNFDRRAFVAASPEMIFVARRAGR
jgi:ubiquinone/menaquinone biosynthesis C-methylase UbiE